MRVSEESDGVMRDDVMAIDQSEMVHEIGVAYESHMRRVGVEKCLHLRLLLFAAHVTVAAQPRLRGG